MRTTSLMLVFGWIGSAAAVGALPLHQMIEDLMPTAAEERYLSIPWRQDLTAARDEAQRTGRPLFLWIMNGHPLGCV